MKTLRFIHATSRWIWFYASILGCIAMVVAASAGGSREWLTFLALVPALTTGLAWGMAEADRRRLIANIIDRCGELIWNEVNEHGRPSPGGWDRIIAWCHNHADATKVYHFTMRQNLHGDYKNQIAVLPEGSQVLDKDEVIYDTEP